MESKKDKMSQEVTNIIEDVKKIIKNFESIEPDANELELFDFMLQKSTFYDTVNWWLENQNLEDIEFIYIMLEERKQNFERIRDSVNKKIQQAKDNKYNTSLDNRKNQIAGEIGELLKRCNQLPLDLEIKNQLTPEQQRYEQILENWNILGTQKESVLKQMELIKSSLKSVQEQVELKRRKLNTKKLELIAKITQLINHLNSIKSPAEKDLDSTDWPTEQRETLEQLEQIKQVLQEKTRDYKIQNINQHVIKKEALIKAQSEKQGSNLAYIRSMNEEIEHVKNDSNTIKNVPLHDFLSAPHRFDQSIRDSLNKINLLIQKNQLTLLIYDTNNYFQKITRFQNSSAIEAKKKEMKLLLEEVTAIHSLIPTFKMDAFDEEYQIIKAKVDSLKTAYQTIKKAQNLEYLQQDDLQVQNLEAQVTKAEIFLKSLNLNEEERNLDKPLQQIEDALQKTKNRIAIVQTVFQLKDREYIKRATTHAVKEANVLSSRINSYQTALDNKVALSRSRVVRYIEKINRILLESEHKIKIIGFGSNQIIQLQEKLRVLKNQAEKVIKHNEIKDIISKAQKINYSQVDYLETQIEETFKVLKEDVVKDLQKQNADIIKNCRVCIPVINSQITIYPSIKDQLTSIGNVLEAYMGALEISSKLSWEEVAQKQKLITDKRNIVNLQLQEHNKIISQQLNNFIQNAKLNKQAIADFLAKFEFTTTEQINLLEQLDTEINSLDIFKHDNQVQLCENITRLLGVAQDTLNPLKEKTNQELKDEVNKRLMFIETINSDDLMIIKYQFKALITVDESHDLILLLKNHSEFKNALKSYESLLKIHISNKLEIIKKTINQYVTKTDKLVSILRRGELIKDSIQSCSIDELENKVTNSLLLEKELTYAKKYYNTETMTVVHLIKELNKLVSAEKDNEKSKNFILALIGDLKNTVEKYQTSNMNREDFISKIQNTMENKLGEGRLQKVFNVFTEYVLSEIIKKIKNFFFSPSAEEIAEKPQKINWNFFPESKIKNITSIQAAYESLKGIDSLSEERMKSN